MGDTAAALTLVVRRNEVARFTIAVEGIDLTGVPLAMQVRLGRGVPGAPLITLATVTTSAAEGLKLEGVTTTGGVPTSIIRGRINQSTMTDAAKVPYAGELGADTVLAYAITWTIAGDTQVRIAGDLMVQDSAYNSDAAPANRPAGYGSPRAGSAQSGFLQFGDQVVRVTIADAALLAPLLAGAQAAATAAAASAAAINVNFVSVSRSLNLFDHTTSTAEAIVDANGTIGPSAGYRLSAAIPVDPAATYTLTRDENYNEYDAAGVRVATHLQANVATKTIVTGAATRFIRFSVENDYQGMPYAAFMVVAGGSLPANFVPYVAGKRVPELIVPPSAIGSFWRGRKWVAVGDSITEGGQYGGGFDTYAGLVAKALGFATLVNRGIGGSSITSRPSLDAQYPPLCSADRIATFPIDADLVTVMMGVNDMGIAHGPANSQDKTTLNGALNSALSQLTARYPTARLMFFTPPAYTVSSGSGPIDIPTDGFNPGTRAVADAILERCQRWSVPCVDLHRLTPFRGWDAANKAAFIPDALHPNAAGHQLVAPLVAEAVRRIATL